jgi:hypothetical protein
MGREDGRYGGEVGTGGEGSRGWVTMEDGYGRVMGRERLLSTRTPREENE